MLPVVDEDHDETDRDIIEDHNIPCGNNICNISRFRYVGLFGLD